MKLFKGVATAVITPFTNSNRIDFKSLKKIIEFQIENNISALVFLGTTGEASTLTEQEKLQIAEFAIKEVNNRVPVILGAGGNNTAQAISLSKKFEKLNPDALLHVTPYYNKCTQHGLFLHYQEIASSIKTPIILYNVPGRTNVNLLPETTIKLSKIPNIIGIKEANSDINQTNQLLSNKPENFAVYSGDDNNIFNILALNGDGVISVVSNVLPKQTSLICDEFFKTNYSTSRQLQFDLLPIIQELFKEVNPIPIKYAMKILGFGNGKTRLPLTKLSNKNVNNLKNILKNYYF